MSIIAYSKESPLSTNPNDQHIVHPFSAYMQLYCTIVVLSCIIAAMMVGIIIVRP